VDAIERASFALLDFLSRQLAGKPVSPVMLFPQYRAAMQLAGADRVHPADLWKVDWQWRELPADGSAVPQQPDEAASSAMETLVLALLRTTGSNASARGTLTQLSDLCANLGAGVRRWGPGSAHLATFWQLAAALFEAQAQGLLATDNYSKRLASRLMAQARPRAGGALELSDRLAQDLLFFCSHARAPSGPLQAPRLSAVRRAFGLDALPTADYETQRLGRFDPALLVLARKRVAAAKDSWSAVAGGEMHRMSGLADQFTLVGESLQRLLPGGEGLALALQAAVTQTVASEQAPPPALAMEVATAILYLDASLEDGEFDHPELAERVQRLAQRIDEVRAGTEPQALDAWMEELYRRVSDRQTMGSVVQELRASLSEIEKQIDQYFRDPTQRHLLIPVPAQLSSMRGVLSVLGLDQASAAALHMRDDVDALAQTEVDPQRAVQTGTFDRLADNLGALSFLIDMLSVQPALAKSLFRYDPATGSLSAVMGQSERISAFAAFDDTAPATVRDTAITAVPLLDRLGDVAQMAARKDLSDAELAHRLAPLARQAFAEEQRELAKLLGSAESTLRDVKDPERRAAVRAELIEALGALAPPPPPELPPPAPLPPGRPPAAAPVGGAGTGLEDDVEMRDIFIEEAREVIIDARSTLERLADAPENPTDLTAVRRAFHTLKGSSRMVGLAEFGEGSWACEQLYNARLAQAPRMDQPLRQFTGEALHYLADWTESIAAGSPRGHNATDLARAADALRLEGVRLPIPAPPGGLSPDRFDAEPPTLRRPPPVSDAEPMALALAPAVVAPPPPGPLAPDFDFDFSDPAEDEPAEAATAQPAAGPAAAPAPAIRPADTLASRVADLPSAADLDLDMPATVLIPRSSAPGTEDLEPAAPPREPETVPLPVFDLDLAQLSEGESTTLILPRPHEGGLLDLPLDAPAPEATAEAVPQADTLEISLDDLDLGFDAPAAPSADAEVAVEAAAPSAPAPAPVADVSALVPALDGDSSDGGDSSDSGDSGEEEQVKVIGSLRIGIPLFNIYLNEADEQSRRLVTDLAEWALESDRQPLPGTAVALAHSLAGNSATVGYSALSALARALEHALMRAQDFGQVRAGEPQLFSDAAEEIRRLLHQFAAGFLLPVEPELMARLAAHERLPLEAAPEAAPTEPRADASSPAPIAHEAESAGTAVAPTAADDTGLVDHIDAELLPIFEEEAEELLPQLHSRLRDWLDRPGDADAPMACMRTLHTIKGGARLAGAMRLGELAHRLESAIEALAARDDLTVDEIDPLMARADAMSAAFDQLRKHGSAAPVPPPVLRAPVALAPAAPPPSPPPTLPAPLVSPEERLHLEFAPEEDPESTPDVAPESVSEPAGADTREPAAAAATAAESPVAAPVSKPAAAELAAGVAPPEPGLAAAGDAAAAAQALGSAAAAEPHTAADSASEAPAVPRADAFPPVPAALVDADAVAAAPAALPAAAETTAAQPMPAPVSIDWARFGAAPTVADEAAVAAGDRASAGGALVRVRAGLLDRMVNQAGEVSIARARIDSDVKVLQGSLGDLTDSLERMRRQLRDIELQAETQITSRIEAAKAASQSFDPLEMDRFTRFQELTRFMAESVNDVATLQRGLQRTLQSTEDELAMQARLTRELQDDLLRTRMVEFDSIADRLHRTARLAARETAKQVRLDIVGGAIEIDRGVLERMTGAFEHLLRNSVAHGVESPEARALAKKEATGVVTVTLAQAGNEVAVEFADDGAGLDLPRIRERAIERGLLAVEATPGDDEIRQFIFKPGFSTAEAVTELAGRGVGLDVVRAEVNAMGGRIETHSEPGRGTRFRLLLPLTTAVTQVVMLRCGELTVAVPSTLVEVVRRVPSAEVSRAYDDATLDMAGEPLPFFWLAALLRRGTRGDVAGRSQTVVVIRSAAQRVVVHVDEVVGNQEVVVKNVGPQLARLPGLTGVTLLPSGAVALIYNPVALAALYGPEALALMQQSANESKAARQAADDAARTPLVLVVDDSLTVRRVTQRLLLREGYRVTTAKDGMEALERLAEERPAVLLSDIEMPRMDGFDLVRNVRADPALAGLPVVMITSRIAQKHRDYAAELGVDHYLGKPYAEEELLTLVARYAGTDVLA
jgi:chemosensory pili system protein ChpA (sensor histidine kinase/response regulator)